MEKIDKSKRRVLTRAMKDPRILQKVAKEKIGLLLYEVKSLFIRVKARALTRYPIIYVRTPKCSSSAIVQSLKTNRGVIEVKRYSPEKLRLMFRDETLKKKIIVLNASRAQWFSEQFPEIWARAYKWSVVRNPYSRVLSSWRFLENLRVHPLVEVLKNPPRPPDDGRYDRDYVHFTMTLTELLSVNGKMYVDRVLHFETLDEDFARLNEELGMVTGALPKVNVNLEKADRTQMDEQSSALVETLFAPDFSNFHYSKRAHV
jgi:hypothetical protein